MTAPSPSVYLVAGESSGDSHATELALALRRLSPGIRLLGMGGPAMRAAGVELDEDLTAHAVMGLWPVLRRLGTFRRLLATAQERIAVLRPEAVVLVDYPGFNLRLAARIRGARPAGSTTPHVIQYVSPQLWAWRPGRIAAIRAAVDHMLLLFPFEAAIYQDAGIPHTVVGHPLTDKLARHRPRADFPPPPPGGHWIALLPGSRRRELDCHFPLLLRAARDLARARPDLHFLVALARPEFEAPARECLQRHGRGLSISLHVDRSLDIMAAARAALVTSGTSTLELACLGTPMVVVYRVRPILRILSRSWLRVPHFALVNILAGRRLAPEFLLDRDSPARLARALLPLIDDDGDDGANGGTRAVTLAGLTAVRATLGPPGASDRAAAAILALIAAARRCPAAAAAR